MTREPVGSVAEEAAKLFAVLQQAASEAKHGDQSWRTHASRPSPFTDFTAAGDAPDPDPSSTQDPGLDADAGRTDHHHQLGPDCVWCPICQLINKVRNTSPETIEHLAGAAAGVLGSVRTLLEAAAEAARQARIDEDEREAATGQPTEQDQPARSRVDRIDVSEDPEPWD